MKERARESERERERERETERDWKFTGYVNIAQVVSRTQVW